MAGQLVGGPCLVRGLGALPTASWCPFWGIQDSCASSSAQAPALGEVPGRKPRHAGVPSGSPGPYTLGPRSLTRLPLRIPSHPEHSALQREARALHPTPPVQEDGDPHHCPAFPLSWAPHPRSSLSPPAPHPSLEPVPRVERLWRRADLGRRLWGVPRSPSSDSHRVPHSRPLRPPGLEGT